MPGFIPSEHDKDLIQWVIDTVRHLPVNSRPIRGVEEQQDTPAPDVYIAKPKHVSGIPAMTLAEDGTGSPSYDRPGSAECSLYTIQKDDNGFKLIEIPSTTRTVYNFTEVTIPQQYLTIHRTKFGHWVPCTGSGGTSGTGTGSICSELSLGIPGIVEGQDYVLGYSAASASCAWFPVVDCPQDTGTGSGSA